MERVGICHHLGRISPVLDVAAKLQIFGVEDNRVERIEERELHATSPYSRAREVSAHGVHTIICGAVSRPLEMALQAEGVRVVGFVCGPVDEVMHAYVEGRVADESFLMPGCCRNAQPFRGGHGRKGMQFRPMKGGPMKIAVSSIEGTLEGRVDERFGRCRKLVICDPEAKTVEVLDNNSNMGLAQGAGIQTAQNVVNAGAKAVISGHFGPKAFQVLGSAGIEAYSAMNMTVKEALAQFQEGKLTKLTGADVSSHW